MGMERGRTVTREEPMTGQWDSKLEIRHFYNEGSSFPVEEDLEEEFEWYRNSKLEPALFEKQEPEFAKRYAEWLKKHPFP
jgi:hypothetical protein